MSKTRKRSNERELDSVRESKRLRNENKRLGATSTTGNTNHTSILILFPKQQKNAQEYAS